MHRILIVKTSSMGDVVHAMPAVTDLLEKIPTAQVDWVVESAFSGLVSLHPGVKRVICSDVRRWRKAPFSTHVRSAFSAFREELTRERYDRVVDLQGLMKSAFIARIANGPSAGFDRRSIREPIASFAYQSKYAVAFDQHAVDRNRALLAYACGYALPNGRDYGLRFDLTRQRLLVCCHATSRDNKLWPEAHWRAVIAHCHAHEITVGLPWGNDVERARAQRLADGFTNARVWPRDPFPMLARDLAGAACVLGVDTGLVHLAAAVGTPVVGLYIATDPVRSGAWSGRAPVTNLGGIGQLPTVIDVIEAISPWLDSH